MIVGGNDRATCGSQRDEKKLLDSFRCDGRAVRDCSVLYEGVKLISRTSPAKKAEEEALVHRRRLSWHIS